MTDPLADVTAEISKLRADLASDKTAQKDLAAIKAAVPFHWASARVWIVVIAIAAAAYCLRADVPSIVNALIPAAKDLIIAFLVSQALVESATVIAGALKK